MMRIASTSRCAVLSFASFGFVRSFTIPTTRRVPFKRNIIPQSPLVAPRIASPPGGASKAADLDDWYADFDPSAFDDLGNQGGMSNRGAMRNPRTRGSGGSGVGHDYERDTSVDNSNVNLEKVNALIADRLEARKTGKFEEADSIRDILLDEHGVSVWDKDKKWRSGSSRSGSGSRLRNGRPQGTRLGGSGSDRGRGTRSRDDSRSFRESSPRPQKSRDFGPNGHDYELASDAGPNASTLSEGKIHGMIAQRLQYKLDRDFQEADAIQQEFEKHGVYVHDGRKEWRADGQRFGGDSNSRSNKTSRMDRSISYTMSIQSEQTDSLAEIQDLVNQRMEAKRARSFQQADTIQEKLKRDFKVEINDKTREWSVGGKFGFPSRNSSGRYVKALASGLTECVDQIQSLVDERDDARKARDFDRADDIKDSLRDEHNVIIDDNLRQWSVGGRFDKPDQRNSRDDAFKPSQRSTPDNSQFVRRGGGVLSEADEKTIMQLLDDRCVAKQNKEFGKADRIRDRLVNEFLIRIDDRSREWSVVTDEYFMSPTSAIDENVKSIIESKIAERSVAKLRKEYDVADSIREELTELYQVVLDDRVREWWIDAGETDSEDASVFEDDEVNGSTLDLDEGDGATLDWDEGNDGEWDVMEVVESASTEGDDGENDFDSLTVLELKEKLRLLGLPLSGKKAELIARIKDEL